MSNQRWDYSVIFRIGELTEEQFIAARTHVHHTVETYAKHFIYQLERGGESKKLHYQCYLNLKNKDRPEPLRKKLAAHSGLEVGTKYSSTMGKEALKRYCMKKDDTFVDGPWSDKPIYLGQDLIKTLRPWQEQIRRMVLEESPHPRKIYWYYDNAGGAGKSSFAKYMYFHHKILTLTIGSAGDLLNVVSKFEGLKAYLFDLSRTKGSKVAMTDLYQTMESVKNGYFVNTKYETGVCCMAIPHVIVFSNHLPDLKALSSDRWVIRRMKNQESSEISDSQI